MKCGGLSERTMTSKDRRGSSKKCGITRGRMLPNGTSICSQCRQCSNIMTPKWRKVLQMTNNGTAFVVYIDANTPCRELVIPSVCDIVPLLCVCYCHFGKDDV